ncbi:MAG: beta-lactamase family protein [Chloroflexi bacterium]|nr:beta-lactamase family protein [Chloroflexota bacterium]
MRESKFQTLLDKQIGRGNIYNIVAGVQSGDGSISLAGAAGTANPKTGAAMTINTPYFIASITKMFTAAVILKLHEQKQISLDDPISKYLPAAMIEGIHIYRGVDNSSQLKVYQLVNQTSGLADYETDKPRGGRSVLDDLKAGQDRAINTEEAIAITRRLSPRFEPGAAGGTKAHYSNGNYRLLGGIIDAVTGKSTSANFEEKIFAPLGLERTYVYDPAAPHDDQTPATVYLKNTPAHIPQYIASNIPDGSLVSTVSENLTFLRGFFEGKLFDKTLFTRMMRWSSLFFPVRYGYGMMYFKMPRLLWPFRAMPELIGHSGSTGSFAYWNPARSLYIAGTINQIAAPAKPFFLMVQLLNVAA